MGNTGKRLMAKCRLLYQENEELGKIISSGRMAKLEGDLALQKTFSEEMKKSQSELDEFLLELDEDVEGMQSTIYYLQQQLRESKDQILQLQKEKQKLLMPNGSSLSTTTNHRLIVPNDNEDDSDAERECQRQSSLQETLHPPLNCQKNKLGCSASPPLCAALANDLNGTEGTISNPSKDKGLNPHRPWTPTLSIKMEKQAVIKIEDQNNIDDNELPINASTTGVGALLQKQPQTPPQQEVILQSVIVENTTAVNSIDKQIPLVQKTDLMVANTQSITSVTARTNDRACKETRISEEKGQSGIAEKISSKRASKAGGGRGHKRTRPPTPVEPEDIVTEDSVNPIRKRTRRSSPEVIKEEAQQTPLEIDTDTEVQVAQTLAYWATTKQERTSASEGNPPQEPGLGNGELKNNKKTEGK